MQAKATQITKCYTIEEKLGEGSFAVVKKGRSKKTGQEVAIKIFNKLHFFPPFLRAALDENDALSLQNEVEILAQLDHPNVVKLMEVYEDDDYVFLVLELMTGGELFDRIVEKEHYSEKEASDTIRPVIDSIKYCHGLGIAHRDLKPENLLYNSKEAGAMLKVSDFGLAKLMNQQLMMTACGTPGYVAPEVLKGEGYNNAVDCWSIGVIIYILLCGFPPFYAESNAELFEQIKKGEFDFPSPYWDQVSEMAKDLIKKILVLDPAKRLTAEQILSHPWVIGEKTPRKQLMCVTDKIKEFNAKAKFRKLATVALAAKKIEMGLFKHKSSLKK